MPLGEEQEELTKNIAQMILEHWVRGRLGILGSAALDQIIPHETDLHTILDAIRTILNDHAFFFFS